MEDNIDPSKIVDDIFATIEEKVLASSSLPDTNKCVNDFQVDTSSRNYYKNNKESLHQEENDIEDKYKSIKFIKSFSQERYYIKKNNQSISDILRLYFIFLLLPFLGILIISGNLGISIITMGFIVTYIFDLLNMSQVLLIIIFYSIIFSNHFFFFF